MAYTLKALALKKNSGNMLPRGNDSYGNFGRDFYYPRREEIMTTPDPRNPKDLIGRTKPPLALFPVSAILQGAMALFAGKTKYGRTNWRATPVYASIYFDAFIRHGYKWWEGEETDPEDGTPHLGNCLACLAIIIDAKVCGTLIDDRQFNGTKVVAGLNDWNHLIPKLEAQYADRKPKHYTIGDHVLVTQEKPAMSFQVGPGGLTVSGSIIASQIGQRTAAAIAGVNTVSGVQARDAYVHGISIPFSGGLRIGTDNGTCIGGFQP